MAPIKKGQTGMTAPGQQAGPIVCVVRASNDVGEARALAAYLGRDHRHIIVERSAKDDDLDGEVCAGRFERVVFADLDALLTAMWDGHVHLDRWCQAGVRLELTSPPPNMDHDHWRAIVAQTSASLARWRKEQRRRRIIAGTILSVLALAALAALLFVAQPVH
jgi:hypothetical protein